MEEFFKSIILPTEIILWTIIFLSFFSIVPVIFDAISESIIRFKKEKNKIKDE